MSIGRRINERLIESLKGNGCTKLQGITQSFFCKPRYNTLKMKPRFEPEPPRIQVRSVRAPLNLLVIIFFCFATPLTEVCVILLMM